MTDSLKNKIEFYERREIVRALGECGGIKAQAARQLGITERMIGYKVTNTVYERRMSKKVSSRH
jgi:transcriptional regulator with GAF, ATPase, and Fis domain